MRAVSLLVLLCCSLLEGQSISVNDITLTHYEGRENQIQAENPRTEPPATTSTQQSCQPDLHSVLREMSAMLEELRVEQRHTTTAVNNMETRLRASESQTEELKKKLEIQSQINQAQAVNQSIMEGIQTELKELKRKNDEEMKDLKTSFKITENQVGSLKQAYQETKVAFSAGLSGGAQGNTGPYNTDVILIYKHVFVNSGGAYNSATGYFTAPVRGVYQFTFHVYGNSGRNVEAVLHRNGQFVAGAFANQSQYVVNSSNGVSLLLSRGDSVCMKLRAGHWIYDNWFHHSTFSGQMLFSV